MNAAKLSKLTKLVARRLCRFPEPWGLFTKHRVGWGWRWGGRGVGEQDERKEKRVH